MQGSGRGSAAAEQLHEALHALAGPILPGPDLVSGVLRRARRLRRRRRVVRGVSSAAAVALVAVGGPRVYDRVEDLRHPELRVAAPPAAVVDIATAYPLAEAPMMKDSATEPSRPTNALNWPSRGVPVASQVLTLVQDYLVRAARAAGSDAGSAVVSQLWAEPEKESEKESVKEPTKEPTKASATARGSGAGTGTFFVLQGWTLDSAGAGASEAVLLAGDYIPASSLLVLYEAPLHFTHPETGTPDSDLDDAAAIAELSVWSPSTDRLVVLGAPQVTKVLYAADGRTLVEEPTSDGVATFPRAKPDRRRGYIDTIQVRDAQNQALTPPGMWSAGDFVLGGDVAVYGGTETGWEVIRGGDGKTARVVVPLPSAAPSPVPGPVPAPSSSGDATVRGSGIGPAPAPSSTPGSASTSSSQSGTSQPGTSRVVAPDVLGTGALTLGFEVGAAGSGGAQPGLAADVTSVAGAPSGWPRGRAATLGSW